MNIRMFQEDDSENIIFEEGEIVERITQFYRNKFQDTGFKQIWCNSHEAEQALNGILLEEFTRAV